VAKGELNMAGCRKTPLTSGKYRGWYTNWRRRVVDFTGTTSPKETLATAKRFEDHHRRIRIGDLPPPKASSEDRDFIETVATYMEAGESNLGRNGFGWGQGHVSAKRGRLNHWQKVLNLKTLHDLGDVLPRVEKELRRLQATNLAGKTLNGYADALKSFCQWAKQRGYLDCNPLDGLKPFHCTPKQIRRAFTLDEIGALLAKSPVGFRLLYTVALCSGLRKNELKSLRVKHLSPAGLTLEAAWTKARKAGFQPLPAWLVVQLVASAHGKAPEDVLLHVPFHSERAFDRHRIAASIAPATSEGVAAFHGLRHTFITLVERTGAREVCRKALARHAFNGLTDGTYTHLDKAELARIVDQIGGWVRDAKTPDTSENLAHSWQKAAAGGENDVAYPVDQTTCDISDVVEVMGVEPTTSALRTQRSPN